MEGSDLTGAQWLQLLDGWDWRCAYCGDKPKTTLQKECVIPLRRGGCYTLANIVPACASCNGSKSGKNVVWWMRRKGFDVDAFEAKMLRILLECA
jgi:hypothetical protein